MALVTDIDTLDYIKGGYPFAVMAENGINTETLDYVDGGMPFLANEAQAGIAPSFPVDLAAGANTINVSAPTAVLRRLLARRFPNVRSERFSTSQGIEKHEIPQVSIQDPALIP